MPILPQLLLVWTLLVCVAIRMQFQKMSLLQATLCYSVDEVSTKVVDWVKALNKSKHLWKAWVRWAFVVAYAALYSADTKRNKCLMKKLAQQEKKSWIVTAKKFRSEPVWILRIEIAAFSGVVSFWFHQICVWSGMRKQQTNRNPGDTPTDKKRMNNMTYCLLSELGIAGETWSRSREPEGNGPGFQLA